MVSANFAARSKRTPASPLLAQESNQRSAFKCERTFDRASEPGPLTAPLEVRLEMRSVCAVALSTTQAPRYGSASRTPQQSDERCAPAQGKRGWPFDSERDPRRVPRSSLTGTGVFGGGLAASGPITGPRFAVLGQVGCCIEKALLWLLSCASKKVTRRRAAPGALSRSAKPASKALNTSDRVPRNHPLIHVPSIAKDAQRHGELK